MKRLKQTARMDTRQIVESRNESIVCQECGDVSPPLAFSPGPDEKIKCPGCDQWIKPLLVVSECKLIFIEDENGDCVDVKCKPEDIRPIIHPTGLKIYRG